MRGSFVVLLLSLVLINEGKALKFNVIHSTDVHGFIHGTDHFSDYSAKFGDFSSFVAGAHKKADAYSADFLVFDSGDFVQGTGLSDATEPKGKLIFEAAEHIPYDALTVGNHDVDGAVSAAYLHDHFVPFWNGTYLSMNTFFVAEDGTKSLMGNPHIVITTSRGARVLVCGYMYDMEEAVCPDNIYVEPMEHVMSDPSGVFAAAMKEEGIDLIVVLGHDGMSDGLFEKVTKEVRSFHSKTPLIMLGGHTHRREYTKIDSRTLWMESWWAFKAVGYLEFEIDTEKQEFINVYQQFVYNNRDEYLRFLKVTKEEFDTPAGIALNEEIDRWFKDLNLGEVEGCADVTYDKYFPITETDSMYNLLLFHIYPKLIFVSLKDTIMMLNTGSVRTDLVKGKIILDDIYTCDPFNSTFYYIPNIRPFQIEGLLKKLMPWSTVEDVADPTEVPHFYLSNSTALIEGHDYNLMMTDYDAGRSVVALKSLYPTVHWESKVYPTKYASSQMLLAYVTTDMPCR